MALARWQSTIVDDGGLVQSAASVEVRRESDNFLVTLYTDRDGTISAGNPVLSDSEGYVYFHVAGSAYKITATKGAFTRVWRYVGIGLSAESDLISPLPGAPTYVGLFPFGSITSTKYALAADTSAGDLGLYINRPSGGTIHFKENGGADQVQIFPSGSVLISPATGTLFTGINVSQSVTGNPALLDPPQTSRSYNNILISSDDATNATGFGIALAINHSFGGSAMTGGRESLFVNSVLSAASSGSSTNRNYAAIVGNISTSTGDGGGFLGQIFAGNFQAILEAGATAMLAVIGIELNIGVRTGAAAPEIKYGMSIINDGADEVAAVTYDAMIGLSAKTGAGYSPPITPVGSKNALLISASNGLWPLASTAAIVDTAGGGAKTIGKGIDLSGIGTITGNAWASPNFNITGAGHAGVGTSATTTSFLTLAAGTTAKSALRFLQGAAPSAPVDGDMWREDNTNTGLKIRINGVTKTITVA